MDRSDSRFSSPRPPAKIQNAKPSKYLAFDIEIAKIVPGDFNNWKSHRPIGISCAATVIQGEKPLLWFSKDASGGYAPQLTQDDAGRIVAYLQSVVDSGYQILTWNGLGFDFDVLSEESGCCDACRELAYHHVDMMFHIFCLKGYPLALNKAAVGMGLPGKTEGMSGEMAPVLWQQGQFGKVLEYVAQDAQVTLDLGLAVDQCRSIRWMSNTGNPQAVQLPKGWLPVSESVKLPEPDISWMRTPMRRKEYLAWLNQVGRKTA
jgi:hypothetical protein